MIQSPSPSPGPPALIPATPAILVASGGGGGPLHLTHFLTLPLSSQGEKEEEGGTDIFLDYEFPALPMGVQSHFSRTEKVGCGRVVRPTCLVQ